MIDYKEKIINTIFQSNYMHYNIKQVNLLKHTGHVRHQQFNIQQLYVLPTH